MSRAGFSPRASTDLPFFVCTAEDLQRLIAYKQRFHPFRKPRVLLRVRGMGQAEACSWETKLEDIRQLCGCTSGAFAIVAFAIASVAYAVISGSLIGGNSRPGAILIQSGVFVIGLILSALVGKLLGLLRARMLYLRTCFDLMQRLSGIRATGSVA
jgi:hypothetical protein